MSTKVPDLQYRFDIDGRAVVVEVCACGDHGKPEPVGVFDVILYSCVSDDLLDHEDDEPEKVVGSVVDHVKRFLPPGAHPEQLGGFSEAVYAWVCKHRAVAAMRAHKT